MTSRVSVWVFAAVAEVFAAVITTSGQDRAYVLRAARVFDGHDMKTPGVVVVRGTQIVSVGNTTTPAGAQVIDFGDATISPGFIDAHTHLSGMYTDDYIQGLVDSLRKTVPEQTLLATQNLRKTLMAGITTARDVGSSD